ncbi:MAG: hypothetical protein J5792_07270 [Bacteroidales bacterium]|nr:hypothetical protein [Bacteroidales bacterium]
MGVSRKIGSYSVESLLPQRPPFVMIDEMIACEGDTASSQLQVREGNLFVENGRLSAAGIMECIAQTCAARIGFLTLEGGGSVKIGVIGSVSNLNIVRTPRVGECVRVSVTIMEEIFQITLIDACVTVGDEVIANARMKIALTEKEGKN